MAQRVSDLKITREQAIADGLKWYFTGEPCKRGHLSRRATANWTCSQCSSENMKARRLADPVGIRSKERKYEQQNIERRRASARRSYARNIEKRHAYEKQRSIRDAAVKRERANRWWRENRARSYAYRHQRRWWIRRATPSWLTKEQRKQMTALYIEARSRPGEWHVDHIIPLRGKLVCGLHVPWNLQILHGIENRRKSNSFNPITYAEAA